MPFLFHEPTYSSLSNRRAAHFIIILEKINGMFLFHPARFINFGKCYSFFLVFIVVNLDKSSLHGLIVLLIFGIFQPTCLFHPARLFDRL